MDFEICSIQDQTNEEVRAGRVRITMSAYEIYPTGDYSLYNRNGIHWEEKYTRENMNSAVGAPFVVRFIDDTRSIISDHGRMTNDVEDGAIIFPDSDTVGHIEKVWIEDREIDGKIRKVLMVSGVIYDQRYHELVKYLRSALAEGAHVKGSVECVGKGNDNRGILYEHGYGNKDNEGNLITPRTPVKYDISALAILADFVPPADKGSQVIEINNLKHTEKESDMNKKDNKEDVQMADDNKSVVELNNKIAAQDAEIASLKASLAAKEVELNDCKTDLKNCKDQIAELNSCKDELSACKNEKAELNILLVEANKTVEAQKAQIAELNAEIEPLRKMKADADADAAQAEVNSYFESIKKNDGFTDAELNSMQTEYVEKCDLNGLKAKETELCVAKFKEMQKASAKEAELNSAMNNDGSVLFFSTKPENVEVNNTKGSDDGSDLFK